MILSIQLPLSSGVLLQNMPIHLGSSPPSRLLTGSTFNSRDSLRHDDTGNTQRVQSQSLSSPERLNPGSDNDRFARPSVYMGDRERPLLREIQSYDPAWDCCRVHENERTIGERERERRESLSDLQRPFDNDRRPPPDTRRRPSYDRRPLPNDGRRLSRFEKSATHFLLQTIRHVLYLPPTLVHYLLAEMNRGFNLLRHTHHRVPLRLQHSRLGSRR